MVSIIISGKNTSQKKITQTIPYVNPNITDEQIRSLVNKLNRDFTTNTYETATKQTTEGVSLNG